MLVALLLPYSAVHAASPDVLSEVFFVQGQYSTADGTIKEIPPIPVRDGELFTDTETTAYTARIDKSDSGPRLWTLVPGSESTGFKLKVTTEDPLKVTIDVELNELVTTTDATADNFQLQTVADTYRCAASVLVDLSLDWDLEPGTTKIRAIDMQADKCNLHFYIGVYPHQSRNVLGG